VCEMEDGELKLDDLISRFEEGRKLLGSCSKKLNEVERKIEMLVDKDGKETTVPFDGEGTTELKAPPAPESSGDELF